jgi:AraC-like DNA-binding protein
MTPMTSAPLAAGGGQGLLSIPKLNTVYFVGKLLNDRSLSSDWGQPAFSSQAPALLGVEFRSRELRTRPDSGTSTSSALGLTSYIGQGFGLFISEPTSARAVGNEIEAVRPVLAFAVTTSATRDRLRPLDDGSSSPGSSIKVAYLPPSATFQGLVGEHGLRSVTLVIDPEVLPQNLDLSAPDLPFAIKGLIGSSTSAIVSHPISSAVQRVAEETLGHVPQEGRLDAVFYRLKALQLFWEIIERFETEDRIVTRTPEPNEKELFNVRRVRTLLQQNPAEEHPIDRLARLAAMNRTKLRSLFKETYGQTISQFRTELRMRRAHQLLQETKLSVAEIGFELGYADASSFIVAFKKFFGFNPGWIRTSQRTVVAAKGGHESSFEAVAEPA